MINLLLLVLALVLEVYHLEGAKHLENSLRGIDRAARAGDAEIDIDLSITKDRRICANHWPQLLFHDGFRDPLRRIGLHALFYELTYAQVRRLVVPRGLYRVQPIEAIIKRAKKRGIGLVLEPKDPDRRFAQDWVWEYISTLVEEADVPTRVYGFNASHLAAARRWGFKTKQLHR